MSESDTIYLALGTAIREVSHGFDPAVAYSAAWTGMNAVLAPLMAERDAALAKIAAVEKALTQGGQTIAIRARDALTVLFPPKQHCARCNRPLPHSEAEARVCPVLP